MTWATAICGDRKAQYSPRSGPFGRGPYAVGRAARRGRPFLNAAWGCRYGSVNAQALRPCVAA